MRLMASLLPILLTCLALPWFIDLDVSAQSEGPVVTDCTPKSGSIDSVIELHGFRINRSDKSNTKVYFLQNGNKYLSDSGGGSGATNDDGHGRQSREIRVPNGLVPRMSRIS